MKLSFGLNNDWREGFGAISLVQVQVHDRHNGYWLTLILAGFGFTVRLVKPPKQYAPDAIWGSVAAAVCASSTSYRKPAPAESAADATGSQAASERES